jgi:hypothetical protein
MGVIELMHNISIIRIVTMNRPVYNEHILIKKKNRLKSYIAREWQVNDCHSEICDLNK